MLSQKKSHLLTVAVALMLVAGILGCNNAGAIVSSEDALFTDTVELNDLQLAREIRLALAEDATLAGLNIAVLAQYGDVVLTGFVNNQYQRDRALHIALAIEGVESVSNKLTIKSPY